jgi:hypothetical protein
MLATTTSGFRPRTTHRARKPDSSTALNLQIRLRHVLLYAGVSAARVPLMSPRRAKSTSQSRQEIAARLRGRRAREEGLIVQTADALSRRSAAESEVAAATEVLSGVLAELESLGFSVAEVAQLLQVDPSEISGTGFTRRSPSRSARTGDSAKGGSGSDAQPSETPQMSGSSVSGGYAGSAHTGIRVDRSAPGDRGI